MLHRLANTPPAGPAASGKVLTLCGRYLHPLHTTTDPDLVGCAVCQRSATSDRTIARNRIATKKETP